MVLPRACRLPACQQGVARRGVSRKSAGSYGEDEDDSLNWAGVLRVVAATAAGADAVATERLPRC